MGATYTRQSTYSDGDTITSAHTNDEFDQLLAAFAASTGHTHDGTAGEGGPISTMAGHALTMGAGTTGTDIVITFDGESNDGVLKWMEDEDYFEFSDDLLIASTEKIQFRDTAIYINSSVDGQLDLVADTEIQIAATTVDINGNVDISGTLTVAGAVDFGDAALSNVGAVQLDSISGDADTDTSITFSGSDVITVTTGGETQITFNNGSILPTSDNDVDLGSSSYEFKDLYIDGTAYVDAINFNGTAISATAAELNTLDGVTAVVGELNALDLGATAVGTAIASKAVILDANKDYTGIRNLTLAGDLTISGDDITMATNTSGHILVADGTNFNPVAVGDLSAISTVASDDVFLAVDTSGGGLKKITRSAVVAGLAAGTMSDIVEDTSPQLGGDLDTNSNNILIDDAHFIGDENGNEQIVFQTTSSAVNQLEITNAASSGNPIIAATGGDTNIGIALTPKGTGEIVIAAGNLNYGSTAVTSTGAELNILDGKAFLDEDNLASDSATGIASQQSIKAYVDSQTAATTVTVTDSTANTNFPVVFHNESNGLLDDTGALRYNPSTGTLLAPNLVVAGTTTTVDTVTMEAANAIIFEGATADAYETTLSIVDPTADHTQYLINQGGYIPVLAAATTTQISSTPAEINLIDGGTARGTTAVASGDGILINDAGTMRMTNVDTVSTYFASHSVGGGNIVTTGALNSGSITSGFGTIDIGSSAFTTTGTVNFGSLADGTITVTAFVDEDDMSTNSATLIPTQQSVKAYVDSSVASAATKGFAIAMAIVFG